MPHRQQAVGATDEWYTPPYIFEALGVQFDMDVASPGGAVTPWIPADEFITVGSLMLPWKGFVWMNPPFGRRGDKLLWLDKFFEHGNGVALVPDRTSAPWWQQSAPHADLVLFVTPKIKFLGSPNNNQPAQGTTLLAIGTQACTALHNAYNHNLGVLMKPWGKS